MNHRIKATVAAIIRPRPVWRFLRLTLGNVSRVYDRLGTLRDSELTAEQQRQIDSIFAVRRVLHGPFKGMRYPEPVTSGALRLGSYEAELGDAIERICSQSYEVVVNIGCGVGYYAVGLAMRIPTAKNYAYDANPIQLATARKMAEMNGMLGRIAFGGFCDSRTLESLDLKRRAFIFCDCEGYERELFSPGMIKRLAPHDLLIESHDQAHIDTTQVLRDRFRDSHAIVEIESIDDILKAYRYEYPELQGMSLSFRRKLLAEGRRKIMRWLVLSSNNPVPSNAGISASASGDPQYRWIAGAPDESLAGPKKRPTIGTHPTAWPLKPSPDD